MISNKITSLKDIKFFSEQHITLAIFGLLFSTAIVSSLWSGQLFGKLELLAIWIGLFILAALGLMTLSRLTFDHMHRGGAAFSKNNRYVLLCFLLLEIVFLVILLSNYPGFCSPDSNDIVNQALGASYYQNHFRYDGLSNHHPIFYTFVFWIIWVLTGSSSIPDLAIFIFLVLQSTCIAVGVAWAIGWLNRHCSSRLLVAFVSLLIVLSPVLLVHAGTMWKDVPFAVALLLLVLRLFDFSEKEALVWKDYFVLFGLCLAVSLLRNNGIYVSALVLLYMIWAFQGFRKRLIAVLASLITVLAIIQGPVFAVCHVAQGHFAETVSVPLQQIAAVVAANGEITEDQAAFFNQIRPLGEVAEAYSPSSTNSVKFSSSFNDGFLESHKIEFLLTWMQVVIQNPGITFKAWVNLTCGYWQPGYLADIGSRVTIYGNAPTSLLGISFDPYAYFAAFSKMFPGFFSMGNVIWAVLISLGILILRNQRNDLRKQITCFTPLLALELTLLIAAPIASDFRYILGMYFSLPFLLIMGNVFGLKEAWRPAAADVSDNSRNT